MAPSTAVRAMSIIISLLLFNHQYIEAQSTFPAGALSKDAPSGTPVGPPGGSGAAYPTENVLGTAVTASIAPTLSSIKFEPVPNQEADATLGLYLDFSAVASPQPIRGHNGATDPGPKNYEYERLNSDSLARPGTDNGDIPNAKWPLGLSSTRSGTGDRSGWARQQNTNELPIAQSMAGVDMALAPNAYRELHWHSANEWAYIFTGSARVSTVNQNGQTYVDDLVAGDLWFFPAGVPHSIQATTEGVEFLLVFNQGDFSEDDTDLVTELFLRNPREVLAKNFQTDVSVFESLPSDQLYIFDGQQMPSLAEARAQIDGPAGFNPDDEAYTYHLSQQEPYSVPGGTVKIVDPTVFPSATNFSVAIFTIEPGAMREIHWHLTSDEWNFFLEGNARVTVFAGPDMSRTFDFTAGDVGYIPVADSHYVENTGNETVTYMEVLQVPKYEDISVAQWLGLTPSQVVKDTLKLPDSFVNNLPKYKPYVVPGNANLSTTNFTVGTNNQTGGVRKRRTMSERRGFDTKAKSISYGYTRNGQYD